MRRLRLEDIEREHVNVQEVMEILGVSKNSVYALLHSGALPALRVGRRFVIPKRALQRLLEDPTAAQRIRQEG